jgi:hypothetical protein
MRIQLLSLFPVEVESITICPTISQKPHNNPTEGSVRQENCSADPDCIRTTMIINIFLSTTLSHNKSQNTQNLDDHDQQVIGCDCDPGLAVGQDTTVTNFLQEAAIENQDEKHAASIPQYCCGTYGDQLCDCGNCPFPLEGSTSTGIPA